jgi:hypothetical protein
MSIDRAARIFTLAMLFIGLCIGQSVPCIAQRPSVPAAEGEGARVRLIVYPDAYFGFDLPILKTPTQ